MVILNSLRSLGVRLNLNMAPENTPSLPIKYSLIALVARRIWAVMVHLCIIVDVLTPTDDI